MAVDHHVIDYRWHIGVLVETLISVWQEHLQEGMTLSMAHTSTWTSLLCSLHRRSLEPSLAYICLFIHCSYVLAISKTVHLCATHFWLYRNNLHFSLWSALLVFINVPEMHSYYMVSKNTALGPTGIQRDKQHIVFKTWLYFMQFFLFPLDIFSNIF